MSHLCLSIFFSKLRFQNLFLSRFNNVLNQPRVISEKSLYYLVYLDACNIHKLGKVLQKTIPELNISFKFNTVFSV